MSDTTDGEREMIVLDQPVPDIWAVGSCVCEVCGFVWCGVLPMDLGQKWEPSFECLSCGNRAGHFVEQEADE